MAIKVKAEKRTELTEKQDAAFRRLIGALGRQGGMSVVEAFRVALNSLAANKLRSALTMLGVMIGVAAVIAMLAVGQGAHQAAMAQIEQMGSNVMLIFPGQSRRGMVVGAWGSIQTLTYEDALALPKEISLVKKVAPEVRRGAQVKYKNKNTFTTIIGTTPDFLEVRNFKVERGRFFNEKEVKSMKRVCILGQTVISNLSNGESLLGKSIRINGISFRVIGLMAFKGAQGWQDPDDQIFVPITTAMRRLFGMDHITSIAAQVVRLDMMPHAVKQAEELLRKRHRIGPNSESDVMIRNQAEFAALAQETSGIFILLLGSIASISLLVGGIGIMNIMLVSVTERTREIGIRKAVGAKRSDILIQFLIESVVLSVVGGGVGILIGTGISKVIANVTEWKVIVTPQSVLLAFFFSVAVGVFFGIYPARKAAALDPIEALRYE